MTNISFHFRELISNLRYSSFWVLTSKDRRTVLGFTNIKLYFWNFQNKFELQILLQRIYSCVNIFHNRQKSDKVQKFNLGNAEGRKWLPSQYTLSPGCRSVLPLNVTTRGYGRVARGHYVLRQHRKEWCQAGRLPHSSTDAQHSNAIQYQSTKLYYKSQVSQQSLACGTNCTLYEISRQDRR